jgi:hypothetical protein
MANTQIRRKEAPYRKIISMTELDIHNAKVVELMFNELYEDEAPFNFSTAVSKALQLALTNSLIYQHQIEGQKQKNGSKKLRKYKK